MKSPFFVNAGRVISEFSNIFPIKKNNFRILTYHSIGDHVPLDKMGIYNLTKNKFYTQMKYLHDNNIVHRDIKPANLIRRKGDRKIVMIDFGAVKEIGGLALDSQGNTNLTIAIGSPGYMPIEQINGKPRLSSDIYAVGMIVIQAITGSETRIFTEHPETAEVMWRDRVQGNYSTQFLDILDKMVRYDFRQRYQTAKEVLTAIAPLSSINDHDLPTLISNPSNSDANNASDSSTIIAIPQAVRKTKDLSTNAQESPSVSRFNSSNVSKIQQQKVDRGKKFLIVGGSIVAIFTIVTTVKLINSSAKPIVTNSAIPTLLPSTPPIIPASTPSPAKSAEELLAQAILLNRNDKPQEALAKSEEALKLDPNNADAWAAKGFSLDRLDRDREAIAAYDKAIVIKPEFPFARQNRALLERKLKSRKK